jgi:hypothetical protein
MEGSTSFPPLGGKRANTLLLDLGLGPDPRNIELRLPHIMEARYRVKKYTVWRMLSLTAACGFLPHLFGFRTSSDGTSSNSHLVICMSIKYSNISPRVRALMTDDAPQRADYTYPLACLIASKYYGWRQRRELFGCSTSFYSAPGRGRELFAFYFKLSASITKSS